MADASLFLRGSRPVWVGARAQRASSRAPWGCTIGGSDRLGGPGH